MLPRLMILPRLRVAIDAAASFDGITRPVFSSLDPEKVETVGSIRLAYLAPPPATLKCRMADQKYGWNSG